jgi:hypothetical protein
MDNAANIGKTRDEGTTRFTGTCDSDPKLGLDKAKEMVSGAVDKAKGAAAAVAHTVGEAGCAVGEKAKEAASAVGSGMKSLAGSIRENTSRAGVLGRTPSSVADTLEKGGRYLQEEGLGGMVEDVARLIRRNPIPALVMGIGLGFLLAKVTTRR